MQQNKQKGKHNNSAENVEEDEYSKTRLIVKNLPSHIDDSRLKKLFEPFGELTDSHVISTESGKKRCFAFVGFKTHKSASRALRQLDSSYLDMAKIRVEFALPKKDSSLARPWSKYSDGSSANQKLKKQKDPVKEDKKNAKKASTDEADKKKKQAKDEKTKFWQNDDDMQITEDKSKDDKMKDESDDEDEEAQKIANDTEMSDMDYFKSKIDKSLTVEKEERAKMEEIEEGRVYITNLDPSTTEDEIYQLCQKFGEISQVHLPIDQMKKNKGYGYILFMIPENADQAIKALDNSIFQGRVIHACAAKKQPVKQKHDAGGFFKDLSNMSYKQKQLAAQKMKDAASGSHENWNSTFMRSDAVAESIARQMGLSKRQLLLEEGTKKGSTDDDMTFGADNAAVRLALAETELIKQTKEQLEEHGVDLRSKKRSTRLILIKNFSLQTVLEHKKSLTDVITDKQIREIEQELFELFASTGGQVAKAVVLKTGTHGLVEFHEPSEARKAFRTINLKKFHHVPLYLEWAPIQTQKTKKEEKKEEKQVEVAPAVVEDEVQSGTLFVKNLSFTTEDQALEKLFVGFKIRSVKIPRRSDGKSKGFGFVEFASLDDAVKAKDKYQRAILDNHPLEIQFASIKSDSNAQTADEKQNYVDEEGRKVTFKKIVVRNVAFEATQRDLYQLFSAFGEIKEVRIPRKVSGKNQHRGFAFIEFVNRKECHAAYDALKNTHLYGRTLKLEFAADDNESLDVMKEKTKKRFFDQKLDTEQDHRPKKRPRITY